jgi:hypothetical protein
MLCRLIYASDVATPFDFGDLQAILAKAQQNNPALDITGLLVMVSQRFLQVIEGPSENVNLLYRKISRDPRHGNCSLVEFGPVPTRLFDDWSMRAIHTGLMNQQLRTLLASKYGTDERGNLVVPDQPFTAASFLFDVARGHGTDGEA